MLPSQDQGQNVMDAEGLERCEVFHFRLRFGSGKWVMKKCPDIFDTLTPRFQKLDLPLPPIRQVFASAYRHFGG